MTQRRGLGQWARTVARTAVGSTAKSPFVQVTKAKKITASLDRKVPYELDGGDRKGVKKLKARVDPGGHHGRRPGAVVSTAARVPETWELHGRRRPRRRSRGTGRVRLLQSAFTRFRRADGTSHSRSLAFATSLVLVQGIVVLVGLRGGVRPVGDHAARSSRRSAARSRDLRATCSPEAVGQANRVGNQDRFLLLTLGLVGLLITSTTAMGQMERGLNRIYGIEKDRPTGQKYALAFVLTLTVGTGLGIAFLLLGFGRSIGRSWGHEARVAWEILRWPIGLALIAVCLAALLSHSANRRQPGRAWLAFGSAVAVVLWALSTIGLALAFRLASNFGQTYGPARRHRRAPAVDLPLGVQHLLRRVGGGRARGDQGGRRRAARSTARGFRSACPCLAAGLSRSSTFFGGYGIARRAT